MSAMFQHLSSLPLLSRVIIHHDAVIVTAVSAFLVLLTYLYFSTEADDAVLFTWERPPEADPNWKGVPLSEPCLHPVDRPSSQITCYDPATGYELHTISSLTARDMSDVVLKADKAWRKSHWNKSSFARRRRVLRSLLAWCLRDMRAIAEVCCRDTGKTLLDAALGEVLVTCEKLRYCIASGEQALKPSYRSNPWMLAHKTSYVKYEPFGLVGAIVSWNYPFHNLISPIIAAIITGNAIVVKSSENIAWSSAHFAKAIRACLEACGEDPDIVQVAIGCEAEAAASFTRDKRLSHLLFIGSDAVGKEVAKNAAECLTPVTLELGGKDPAVVLASADLKTFAQSMLKGSFTGAGQGCIAIERFICEQGIYDDFVRTMEPLVRKLRPGVDVGAMINSNRLPVLQRLVDDAVKQGAKLLVGGRRYKHPKYPHASYFEPTMLSDVTADMAIAQQECFAPIMLVSKARDKDHCIELANESPYGLGSSVWGRNKAECRYVADNLVCGMVAINDFATFYICQDMPFGGVKHSGYARFGGPEGLRSLCNVKSVIEDRWHGVIQTTIPGPVQYPIADKNKAFAFIGGTISLFYEMTWGRRLRGIKRLIA